MQDNTPVTNEEKLGSQSAEAAVPQEAAPDAQPQDAAEAQPVKTNIFGKAKKEKPKKPWQQEVLEWILVIVVAVVMAFVIRTFLGEMVRVDGNSMYATLHDGEVMVVEKTRYSTAVLPFNWGNYAIGGQPERFDVVICHYPGRGNTNFVKRVVGLPGDTLMLQDGKLCVNGQTYDEPYLVNRMNYSFILTLPRYVALTEEELQSGAYPAGTRARLRTDLPESGVYVEDNYYRYYLSFTVPEGQFFVLGDNRSNSNDSHLVGPLDRNMIIGRVFSIILPKAGEKIRLIPNGLEDEHTRVTEPGL